MEIEFKLYQRPSNKDIIKQIINIINSLTGKWFTENVAADTERDLLFQDVLCITIEDKIVSFIIFTCWDGSIYITLMGTKLEHQGLGLGSKLMNYFCSYIKQIGFDEIVVLTVPPKVKPSYNSTVNFYIKNGFEITQEYQEMWENGAVELIKDLAKD
ncbi:GNAT family N-acetyltransferase [Desnuesiella massiliensis]|uniref:GNAT family N-acetyltransferase n=1 Tax=Desnuesiella massiliensis TaxID=1650662 RepID=UPI0006E25D32|nr:GNAT family N-acetyltransferase [Desnuesiella massiliensis]